MMQFKLTRNSIVTVMMRPATYAWAPPNAQSVAAPPVWKHK